MGRNSRYPPTVVGGIKLFVQSYATTNTIIFVPTAGAIVSPAIRTIFTASTRITALHAGPDGIYWGEETGAVRRKNGSTVTTIAGSGLFPTSISTDAILAPPRAWTQCASTTCRLRVNLLTGNSSTAINPDAFGVFVKTSGSSVLMFWGDAAGVHRKQF